MAPWIIVLIVILALLLLVALFDTTQRKHTILRNFPIIGHFRYALEKIGPEIRQYFVANNNEERPFSRDERRFVYASSKRQNSYFGFGTDDEIDQPGYVFFRPAAFPHPETYGPEADELPMMKSLGERHGRDKAFTPQSMVHIAAMSYGALSAPAIQSLNRGAAIANCLHNTGEGGISDHHRLGGKLILQIGTGYFGARDADGNFSMDALLASLETADVGAIEIKLSQGAKPGLGGVLPGKKVTPEIAQARGVEIGVTVRSPNRHRSFGDVAELIDFVELIATETGLPVGIKSAVGEKPFWKELASTIAAKNCGPDFIAVDGGEGGTGAAPLPFSDHVSLPFREGFAQVRRAFIDEGIADEMVFFGSGRLGLPTNAVVAAAMGADAIYIAREAMLSIGCIQAQLCHNGRCPTGIATHSRWLTRGLDPDDKAVRFANYVAELRHEMRRMANAMGVEHPTMVDPEMVAFRVNQGELASLKEQYLDA